MGLLYVDGCCCGFPLEKGVKVIGLVEAISYLVMLILLLWTSINVIIEDNYYPGLSENSDTSVLVLFLICAAVALVQMILSLLLFQGAKARNPARIRPWLIFSVISLVIFLGSMISMAVIFSHYDLKDELAGALIIFISIILFKIYFTVVVHSYFRRLMEFV